MNCPHCGKEWASDEAVPKAIIRKLLNECIEAADSTEDKVRAIDLLSKLEGFTGPGLKKDQRKVGVFIVQHSSVPGKGPKLEAPPAP